MVEAVQDTLAVPSGVFGESEMNMIEFALKPQFRASYQGACEPSWDIRIRLEIPKEVARENEARNQKLSEAVEAAEAFATRRNSFRRQSRISISH